MITLRYETDHMSKLRDILQQQGKSDDQIDKFKDCLIALEHHGFILSTEDGIPVFESRNFVSL